MASTASASASASASGSGSGSGSHDASLHSHFLARAPAYLSLHSHLSTSLAQLDVLHSFLTSFSADLLLVSSHISELQTRFRSLEMRLSNRRQLEGALDQVVVDVALDPNVVEGIVNTEPGKQWGEWLRELERVIHATAIGEEEAKVQTRQVVEKLKLVAAAKLRASILSPLSSMRKQLSTNVPMLQSLLLATQRASYGFLARHAPRVAIDVQREYVAMARLYYETGFRRYARSLGAARERCRRKEGRWGVVERPATPAEKDAWLLEFSAERLEHAKLEDGPPVVLAYQADDIAFRTTPEALFRSLALVLLDNACAEYTFICRFFDDLSLAAQPGGSASHSSAAPRARARGKAKALEEMEEEGPQPEESASVVGAEEEEEEEGEVKGTIVALSVQEQRALELRSAGDELWRQVMEPVLGTWNTFIKSLLSPSPPLLSLLTMIHLNTALLAQVAARGVARVLQPTLVAFKMQAYPLLQKAWEREVEGMRKLADGGAIPGAEGGLGGFVRAATGGGGGRTEMREFAGAVCARYAHLYSSVVVLADEADDTMLFSSLLRMRTELERFLSLVASKARASDAAQARAFEKGAYEGVKRGLENGPAPLSHPRVQSEMSHFSELQRAAAAA